MRILQLTSYYEPAYGFGGDVRTVSETCKALAEMGLDVTVLTTNAAPASRLRVQPSRPQHRDGVRVTYYPLTWRGWPPGRFYYSRGLARACARRMPEFDVAHFSSFWGHPSIVGTRACASAMVPYVISPHGSLEPWCYAHRGWKKRLHMRLCGQAMLDRAAAVHAVCLSEARNLAQFGLEGKIACIPPGIDMSDFAALPSRMAAEERWPALRGRRVILFLSRLHHKKGLDQLLPAFAELRRYNYDVLLVLAGPDDGYRRTLHDLIDAHGIRDDVLLTGMLSGRDRLLAFAAADVFVLPSYAEGLPRVLIEAMACRLPVLSTPGCNFPEVAEADAGLIVEPSAPELATALQHLMAMTDDEREAMGARGRQLVQSEYTWDLVARKMITVYQSVVDGATVPLHPEPYDGQAVSRCCVAGRGGRSRTIGGGDVG